MEEQLNMINDESKKIGLKIHRGKTKYMTNFNTNKKIIVENTEIEKVEEYRYLGQNIEMKDKTLKEVQKRIRAGWSAFGKYKFIFTNKEMSISLKRKTFNACIIPAMTYGCETWTLTKTIVHKLQVAQRAMERKNIRNKDNRQNPKWRNQCENQYTQHHKTHNEYKMEMGWTCGKNARQ